MSLTVNQGSGQKIEPVPEGVHVAVCYGVVDLGTHLNPIYGKKVKKVLLMWEIPELRITVQKDGKEVEGPRVLSKTYTASLHEKANLRKDLEAWRGKKFTEAELDAFDLRNILGKACQLQVVHDTNKKGDIFANIGAIMSLPKGMKAPNGELNQVEFDFDKWDGGDLPAMPDWIVRRIQESDEFKKEEGADESVPDGVSVNDGREDLPF